MPTIQSFLIVVLCGFVWLTIILGLALAEEITIYEKNWQVKERIQDGTIYDRDWILEKRIEDGKIYEQNWNLKGRFDNERIYDRNWNTKGYLRKVENRTQARQLALFP